MLEGVPILVRFRRGLRASRGRLLSGEQAGAAVHAGSFLNRREIVLDSELLAAPKKLGRIFTHEVFHFVWRHLDNETRSSYEAVVSAEIRGRARGELGWSAEWRKQRLAARDRSSRTRRWREYVCESFCDTAAWLFTGGRRNSEFTLEPRYRAGRRRWFRHAEGLKRISI